ncbi:MAG: TldD/PmbA family protein [Thermodesulfobacteriota bacterium]|nr:TldD/PmbA family protein [Thermodesulfobacteriota bacterium]
MDIEDKISKTKDLLRARSINAFEIFGSVMDSIDVESRNKDVSSLDRCSESGIGLRVMIDGGMGFAYGADPSNELIDAAIQSAKNQFKDKDNVIPQTSDGYTKTSIYDKKVLDATVDDCIERAIQLELSSREEDERIAQVRKASYSRYIGRLYIVNSNSIEISSMYTQVNTSIMVMAKDAKDAQAGFDSDLSHYWDGIDVVQVGKRAAAQATQMLGARRITTTKIPILLDNMVAAQMLEFMSNAFLGENVIKGKSFLADKLGEKVFSSNITISDNPLDPRAEDAHSFDGEGVPSRKTHLVDCGVVNNFVYDTYWGRVANKASTGNSLRTSYRQLPTLGMRHLCMEHPSADASDLAHTLKKLKQVLKITDIMGMHTADPISGEFSIGVDGLLIEDGNICYPVREAAIAGNVCELFSKVLAIGDDVREVGQVLTPSVLIDKMDVSAE